MAEHWSLVVAKPENAKLSKFKEGDFKSVTLEHAITRLENIAGEKFSESEKKTFRILREHRNKLVHFFHGEYVDTTAPQTISRIVSEQCRAWLYLHRLLTLNWKEHFIKFDKEISKLDRLIHENRKFLKVKYESLVPKLKALLKTDFKIVTCPSCGFHAFCQAEAPAPIKECTCMVCGYHDRYVTIQCPDCRENLIYDGSGIVECTKYQNIIAEDDIIEQFKPLPDDPDEDLIAYCYYCEHIKPSVIKLSDQWVCLVCLEPHDEPENYPWCNEFVTAYDLNAWDACSQCGGRRSWDNDD